MWKESKGIERDIILKIYKKQRSISEISKELNKPIQTISKTIERMQIQNLIERIKHYSKDARRTEVVINKKRIKVEKTHTFYLPYYILILISLIFSGIISSIIRNSFLFIGSLAVALPVLTLIIYQIYVKGEKVIVYKNPKEEKSMIE